MVKAKPKPKPHKKLRIGYRIYCRAPLIVSYHKDDKKIKRLKRVLFENNGNGFVTGLTKEKLFEYFVNAIRPSKRGKNWLEVRLLSGDTLVINLKYFKVEKMDKK